MVLDLRVCTGAVLADAAGLSGAVSYCRRRRPSMTGCKGGHGKRGLVPIFAGTRQAPKP